MTGEIYPSGVDYAGTVPLRDEDGNLGTDGDFKSDVEVLTDAADSRTYIIDTENIKDLFFDVSADKGATVIITPLIDIASSPQTEGLPSDTAVVVAGTPFRGRYTDVSTYRVKIVVTKTDGGDMTEYTFMVRGSIK